MSDNKTPDMFEGSEETPRRFLVRNSDPATSHAAAYAVPTTDLEQEVLELIRSFGERGCIMDDCLGRSNLPYGTLTPRFAALLRKGRIMGTGETRTGRSGRQQRVMVAL